MNELAARESRAIHNTEWRREGNDLRATQQHRRSNSADALRNIPTAAADFDNNHVHNQLRNNTTAESRFPSYTPPCTRNGFILRRPSRMKRLSMGSRFECATFPSGVAGNYDSRKKAASTMTDVSANRMQDSDTFALWPTPAERQADWHRSLKFIRCFDVATAWTS